MNLDSDIVTKYREDFPLFDAYRAVVEEHNSPSTSINDSADRVGGIDRMYAAKLAVARIGRPARDDFDIECALMFINKLEDEISEQAFPGNVDSYVVGHFFQYASFVPTADDWINRVDNETDTDVDTTQDDVDEIVQAVPTDDLRRILTETLMYAMPAILTAITEADRQSREG